MLTPRPYQEVDIQVLINGYQGSGADGGEMGTGKTLKSVEVARRTGCARVLIIAPLITHGAWETTIRGQIPDSEVFVHPPGGSKSKAALAWWERVATYRPGFYIIGWEAFRGSPTPEMRRKRKEIEEYHRAVGMALPERPINKHWGFTGMWDLVIGDEFHRAANRKSTTHKTLLTLVAKRKLALSGTLAGNKVEGFFACLQWLWPADYQYFWPWVSKYCVTELDPHAGRRVIGEITPGAIIKSFPTYVRHTTAEVIKDLPEVIERKVVVPMRSGTQSKAYKELEEEAFTWLENQPLATPVPITLSLRLRQLALGVPIVTVLDELNDSGDPKVDVSFAPDAKSNKIDALKDIIADIPEDEPVLILTHSARFAVPVVAQLNKLKSGLAVRWTGETSQAGRKKIMADFGRKGGPRFIVAGIAAIGEGVDGLQHRAHHEVWLSEHDNNLLNQQAQARLHRSGQAHPVQRWYVQSRGTVDSKVYTRLKGNAAQMRAAYRRENPR